VSRCNAKLENVGGRSGFTLTELVVVIGLLVLVALLVLPALAAGRNNNRDTHCVDNQRRLAAGWLMYAGENNDVLMNNGGGNPNWVAGVLDWEWGTAGAYYNTNTSYLTDPAQSAMASYVRDPQAFRCPADVYTPAFWPVPRVRSVSMNGALAGHGGSGPTVKGHNPGGRIYYGSGGVVPTAGRPARTMSDLNMPGPARIYLILDQHPDSIEDGTFLLDPGRAATAEMWRDLPASYHDGGAVGISYADGHAEIHRWLERRTMYPVIFHAWWWEGGSKPWTGTMNGSKDFEWLQDGMPYRLY